MKRPINIKNVAALAQVSISTVSRVLNDSANVSEELKERVYKAIEETQYSVNPIASTLKSTKRNQIAIVLPSLRQTYYTDIIKGASDYCYERQVTPIILESGGEAGKEQNIIESLEKQWVDGIIFIPCKNAGTPGYIEFIDSLQSLKKQESRIPVILTEYGGSSAGLDVVRVDYETAFYKMTYHLLEIGRKNIAYLSCPKDSSLYEMCLQASQRALRDYGGEIKNVVLECSGYTILEGYRAMNRLLEQAPDIDGVVCVNDQVASGALHACKEASITHDRKIAIVGFGGVAMSIITTPSITTMVAPRYEIGVEAASLLFQRMQEEKYRPEERILLTHMAIRDSTLRTGLKKFDSMFSE